MFNGGSFHCLYSSAIKRWSLPCCLSFVSEELDSATLMSILTDFALKMGAKWHSIGIKLGEVDHVGQLQSTPQSSSEKILLIIDQWLKKDPEDPVKTMIEVLRSPGVGLNRVATEFQKVRLLIW